METRRESRRDFLRAMGVGAASAALPRLTPDAGAATGQPNILVMLSDDMGWGQPGFQGGQIIPTPNLDRLATEGVNLTQFYVQPVCTPTRACLLTGRYAFRTGTVIRFTANDTAGMLLDEQTLAQALRDAGYFTGIVGKWHLGEWQKAHLPMQRGFDRQYGHYSALIDYHLHTRNGVYDWHRNEQPVDEDGYSTDLIADETIRLIREHDGARPFFLYVPFNAVHGPHQDQAPRELIEKYTQTKVKNPAQAAQVECMDAAIGRILSALDDKGIRDNTLVMFFNDNGGPAGVGPNGPYRGGKSSYLEGGIRVACLMRWPGKLRAGSAVDEPLHVVDMYPTFVKLAGGSLKQQLPIDGLDAWATIAEGKRTPHEEIVHGLKVIRVGDWKYIDKDAAYYGWKSEGTQLYNIREDPYEQSNLAEKLPGKVKQLQDRLAYWATQERPAEEKHKIAGYPVTVYGEEENKGPHPAWLLKRVEHARTSGRDKTVKDRARGGRRQR